MFDMTTDSYEKNNLISGKVLSQCHGPVDNSHSKILKDFLVEPNDVSLRKDYRVHQHILHCAYPSLSGFADHGSDALKLYLKMNPHRNYPMSDSSDFRSFNTLTRPDLSPNATTWTVNIQKAWPEESESKAKILQNQYSCKTPCTCDIPTVDSVPPLPFNKIDKKYIDIRPNTQLAKHLFNSRVTTSENQIKMVDSGIRSSHFFDDSVEPETHEDPSKRCVGMKMKYGVATGRSWGALPDHLQILWKSSKCDELLVKSLTLLAQS